MKKSIFIICIAFSLLSINPGSCEAGIIDWITNTFKFFVKKEAVGGSSTVLASRLGISQLKGWAAHHIIPVQLKSHPALKKVSFDLDIKENGIALPMTVGTHPILPVHAGSHPRYTAAVARELDKIPTNLSEEQTRTQIFLVIDRFRQKLESGVAIHNIDGVSSSWW